MKTCRSCQSANLDQASVCSVCGAQSDDFTITPQSPTTEPHPGTQQSPGTHQPSGAQPPPGNQSGYATPQIPVGPPPSGPQQYPGTQQYPGAQQYPPPSQYQGSQQYQDPQQYPGPSAQPSFQGATVYAPPGTPGGYVQTTPTNNMAITSLVLSLVGVVGAFMCLIPIVLAPAGAITGHVALSRIKSSGQSGRGLALAGVIVGWLGTAAAVAVVVLFIVFAVAASNSTY